MMTYRTEGTGSGPITVSYLAPRIPPSFAITATATFGYVAAYAATAWVRRAARDVSGQVVPAIS